MKWVRDNRGFLLFLLLLGLSRTAVADWNHIPSSSMRPTLLEGDRVLVNRLAFDLKLPLTTVALAHLGDPARGDVITFRSPVDDTRLIKRVIGLPGDVVEMRGRVLAINGHVASYAAAGPASGPAGSRLLSESIEGHAHTIRWDAGSGAIDSFWPVTVPPDHFLVLGDNRDHSADSRYFGFVPRHLLIGRAERVLLSLDGERGWLPRLERSGLPL